MLCALAACEKPAPPLPPPSPDAEAAPLLAPLSQADGFALRAALMRAHLAAGMGLADEGQAAEAGAQLRLPARAIYEPDQALFAAKGYALETEKFELAAMRAEMGASAVDLVPLRDELERQIARFAPRQFSKPVVVGALLKHLAREYARGVEGQTVVRPADYYDAYGLAIVTLNLVTAAVREGAVKDDAARSELQREAEALVNMFPSASAPVRPAAPGEMQAQISRVRAAYPGVD